MLPGFLRYKEKFPHLLCALFLALTLILTPSGVAGAQGQSDSALNQTYTNPLHIAIPNSGASWSEVVLILQLFMVRTNSGTFTARPTHLTTRTETPVEI